VRCISRGVPASMFPSAYNNAYQVLQMPGYVVIYYEMIHDARIIPLDGRPRAGSDIRLWMGNSRGRWEGDTLVVEATNFHDRGAVRGHPHSEQLQVVERFTRVSPDQLAYEATVTDPKGLDDAVESGDRSGSGRRLPDVRVCVPRGQPGDREHPERRPDGGSRAALRRQHASPR
jgi:hypothetical protein